jgi:WD40 repeat protein
MFRSHQFRLCVVCFVLGLLLVLAFLFLAPSTSRAAPGQPLSFVNDVAPILKENCFACHDSKKRKGKFDMTTYEGFRKGGDKADPIAPGKPEESLLIDVLTAKNASRMPPKETGEALPKEKIALIQQWIKEGAKLDDGIAVKSDLLRELRVRWKPPTPSAVYSRPVTITALAFTPDNQKLIVGGNHELTVWDIAQAKLEKRIYTRAERAYAILVLPDGKLAVAGGRPGQEGDVKIYDINGGTPRVESGVTILDGVNDKGVLIAKLLEVDDSVNCLALSADGKKLASGGCDRIVNVWDLSPGYANAKLEQSIENHADWVFGIAFTADGKHLLTASRDKTAKVWDLATKESVLTFPDHQATVYGVAVKPDGKIGVSSGEDKQIRFWNTTGDPKQVAAVGGHGEGVYRLLYHPTQPLLFSCSGDKTVRIWNADSRAAVKTLSGHTDQVYALAVSPDGNLLASGSYNGEVRVWKIADGSVVKEFNGSPGYVAPISKK